jgi:MFS family permease
LAEGSLWQNRDFVGLWSAATVTNFGSMVTRLAIPFAAIGLLGATASDLAWLTAAGLVPGILVSLFAGSWADRHRKRPLLIASDLGRAALYLSIPAAALTGLLSLIQLYAVAFVAGCLRTIFDVAHVAYLPALVDKTRLVEANSQLRAAEAVTEGAAFGTAGWLVQLLSAPLAVAIDSVSFLASASLLAGIRHREEPAPRRNRGTLSPSALTQAMEGLRFTAGDPLLRNLLGNGVLLALSYGLFSVVFLLFAHGELGFPEGGLGMVFAVGAGSSLLGAILARRVTERLGTRRTMITGLAIYAASTLLVPIIPEAGVAGWALLVGHQLGDGGEVTYSVNHVSLRQANTPPELLGRVNGAFEFAGVGAMLLGTALGGVLGEWAGLRATLLVSSGFALAAALWLLGLPASRMR